MKIGYPGNTFEIPAPLSGMGFGNNSDAETFELDSGGRHVVDKATTYKSFNMSWRSKTKGLQPLIDIYNKRYGSKPFYIQDMHGGEGNILPPRWAYPEQLVAIHGACGDAVFKGGAATFTSNRFWQQQPSITVPLFLGKPMYLAVFPSGTPTGIPMAYRLIDYNGLATIWYDGNYTIPGNAPQMLLTREETQQYEFVELQVNLYDVTHAIKHVDLSTSDYRSHEEVYRSAEGVGGVRFTNVLDGEMTMLRTQKIGLSVDLVEVQ